MRVGVEVGGTFTDLVAIGPNGVSVTKVPSVPKSPDIGAINAIIESGIPFAAIEDLAHGSTVATNAVLERKGFPTAFVTTKGFRDILILERHGRNNIYDLEYQKPTPVVARAASFEVVRKDPGGRLGPDSARSRGRRARPGAGTCGGRLPGGRHLPPEFLCQRRARARAAGSAGRETAEPARHHFIRDHAGIPRIRARVDDDAVGLRATGHRWLHRALLRPAEPRGFQGPILGDAVEWRSPSGVGDARQCHQRAALRARRRRHWRPAASGTL